MGIEIIGVILLLGLSFLLGYYLSQYFCLWDKLKMKKQLLQSYENGLRRCGYFIYENADYIKELMEIIEELKDLLEDDEK